MPIPSIEKPHLRVAAQAGLYSYEFRPSYDFEDFLPCSDEQGNTNQDQCDWAQEWLGPDE